MTFPAPPPLDAPLPTPRPGRWPRERIFWVFQVLFWGGIGASTLQISAAARPDEPLPWVPVGMRVASGFASTSIVHGLFGLVTLRALARPQRWATIAVLSSTAMAGTLVLLANGPAIWQSETSNMLLAPRLIVTCMWCAAYFGLDLLDDLYKSEMAFVRAEAVAADAAIRALTAESAAQQHELRRLQEQMNPHFLFNALNAVVASKHDPEAVEQVTQDLSEYLRFALREARTLEPLSRELHALKKYLAVQQRRFGRNLDCRITVDTAAPRALAPPMMIQPLLENALHYGSETSGMPLRVTVRAQVREGWLEVVVANSGRWVAPDPSRSSNTGIRSLRRRLELLAGQTATVDVRPEPDQDGGWVRVVVRLRAFPYDASTEPAPTPA